MTISGIPPAITPRAVAPRAVAPVAHPQATPPREPGLWAMLSPAERAFFLAPEGQTTLGYGRTGTVTNAAPVLGQHVDVVG